MLDQRIRQLKNDNNWNQAELGKRKNLAKVTISQYENETRSPNPDIINQFADLFGVSVDYLLGRDNNKNNISNYITVNVYGSIPAGISIEAIENISDTEDLSLKEYDKNKTYLGLKVEGDSMYPKYLDGDTVIIEKCPDCESGTDAAVYVNGYEATLKTVIKNENGTITLKPINPNYSPQTYGVGDEPVKILGIVKEIRRKI
ncbi:S24 family peptidase [Anaerococcus nagyae]|uniref:LexA family protein n=1 Tax=Anaerococcus nagyae TaxID=1755241 RepID=UPI0032478F78